MGEYALYFPSKRHGLCAIRRRDLFPAQPNPAICVYTQNLIKIDRFLSRQPVDIIASPGENYNRGDNYGEKRHGTPGMDAHPAAQ